MHKLERRYTFDLFQRFLHWWIACTTVLMLVTGLYASNTEAGSERAYLWLLHIRIGYAFTLGLVARLMWLFLGSRFAKLESFIHLASWLRFLKTRKLASADQEFGHHPQASLSYLAFYALISLSCVTGLVLAAACHGEGPLTERFLDQLVEVSVPALLHENIWYLLVGFIVTHVGAIMIHEVIDRIPIAQSMVSGYQYRTLKEKDDESND